MSLGTIKYLIFPFLWGSCVYVNYILLPKGCIDAGRTMYHADESHINATVCMVFGFVFQGTMSAPAKPDCLALQVINLHKP